MSESIEPAEQKNVWYYRPPTQQPVGIEGPLTGVQLLQRAKEGKIGLATLVRNPVATKNQWVPAEKIPSLAAAIGEAKNNASESGKPVRLPPVPAPAAAPVAVTAAPEPVYIEAPSPPVPLSRATAAQAPNPFTHVASDEPNPFSPPLPGGRHATVGVSSKERYPNLHRYMFALKTLSMVGLIIFLLIGAGFAVGSLLMTISGMSLVEGLVGVLTGVVIAGIGYLYYVLFLAGLELIQVVVDIEANTRGRRDG